jgi:L-serine dehydratase
MISVFDIFKVGLGPSSSHTVGPMKAAAAFVQQLDGLNALQRTGRIAVEVYGSLALTGEGHGTFEAILLGLEGEMPDSIDLNSIPERLAHINSQASLPLDGKHEIEFIVARDIVIRYAESLPKHPNGLRFTAYDTNEQQILQQVYYSVGGGFIVTDEEFDLKLDSGVEVPYPFHNAQSMAEQCVAHNITLAELILANEMALQDADADTVKQRVRAVAQVMFDCVDRGLHQTGELPGGLKVKRRAPYLAEKLSDLREANQINTQLWPNQWRRRHHPLGIDVFSTLPPLEFRRRHRAIHAHRRRHWHVVQNECLDFGCGRGLPRRSGRGLLHGCGRLLRHQWRYDLANPKRCRNGNGTPLGFDLRPSRRLGTNPMH